MIGSKYQAVKIYSYSTTTSISKQNRTKNITDNKIFK